MLKRLWRFCHSLQLAVIVIVSLAGSLAAGTILESYYDTKTAWYYVYDAAWFPVVIALLGINIAAVMVNRWPWKRPHAPFLLAHIGILFMIFGSWVTTQFGIDGTIAVREGETRNMVEFDESILYVIDGNNVKRIEIPWRPPLKEFASIEVPDYGLTVDQYLTHAEPKIAFTPAASAKESAGPALKITIAGGPMQIKQDLWLWAGDPAWSSVNMGPVRFSLHKPGVDPKAYAAGEAARGQARMDFIARADGALEYRAISMRGEKANGRVPASGSQGRVLDPGWKGVTVTIKEWIPYAENQTSYVKSRVQFGSSAPPSAIRVSVGGEGGTSAWLGLGDQATLELLGREISLSYLPRRVVLPFGIYLERFQIDHYQGTRNPMSYSSLVRTVENAGGGGNQRASSNSPILISMNEPLKKDGYTFYQASFVPGEPRPVVSVFSVNRDPGRPTKYVGAVLLVLGCILLFARRHRARSLAGRASVEGGNE